MNRTPIAGIPVALFGVCLAAHCLAAQILPDDSDPQGDRANIHSSREGLLEPLSGGMVPPEFAHQPASEDQIAVRTTQAGQGSVNRDAAPGDVPASEPLPNGPAEAQPSQSPLETAVEPAPTAAGRSANGAQAPAQQPAGPRVPTERPQEIQFDPQGLITLHTNELDVRQLLELISRRSGMNILLSPTVKGNITANFEKIPVDQLVKSVLKLANLVEKVEGDVHYIYSRDDLKNEAEDKKRERILTKVYRLNYVRADELMVMITPFLSVEVGRKRFSTSANYTYGISEASTLATGGIGTAPIGGAGAVGGGAIAAPGGAGTIQRGTQPPTGGLSMSTNDMVVIQDYESNLKIIDQIIRRIDVRPVQVLIEAVIISVELARDKQLGVNFALVDNLGQQLGTIGAGAAINGNVGFTPAQVLTAAGKIAASTPPDPTGFASATNGIKYGFVSNNVTGFIRAIETLGSTKILASPRLLVLNKQRAEIQLGARLGFRTLSQNYTSTIQQVQFLNIGTLLRLRPFVSTDGMVRMEIHPERSSGVVQDDLPSARTAELTTNVMVPDGATLVIGGLMEDEDTYQQQGLPGLSRVPLLGAVFGFKQRTDTRRELVVLLTPHIWSEDAPYNAHGELARKDDRPAPEVERVSAEVANRVAPAAPPASRGPAGRFWRRGGAAASTSDSATGSRAGALAPMAGAAAVPIVSAADSARIPDRPSATVADPRSAPVRSGISATGSGLNNRSTRASRPVEPHTAGVRAPSTPLQRPSPIGIGLQQHHRVTEGESLQSIAQKYYGSARYAPALWEANRAIAASPQGLTPGVDLLIPDVSELDPTMLQVIEAASPTRLASRAPTGRGESSAFAAAGQRRPRPAARSTDGGEPGAGRSLPAGNDPVRQAPIRASAANPRPNGASAGLTDTLESQPDSKLSDVIEPSTPLTMEDSPVASGTTSDSMVRRAGFEAIEPAAGPSRLSDEMAFPPRESASERPVRSASPGASGGVDQPDMSRPRVAPAESQAIAQAQSGRFTLPDFEPIPSQVPVSTGSIGEPRQTPGTSGEMLLGSTPSPPAGTGSRTDNARNPSGAGGSGVPDEGGFAVHIMKANESWASIARDRLGDSRRADELFKMNREFYGEGFRPRPGMRLVLPPRERGAQVPTGSRERP